MIDLVQERKKMTEKTAGSVKLLPRTGILTACFCCCFVLFLCFGFLCACVCVCERERGESERERERMRERQTETGGGEGGKTYSRQKNVVLSKPL